MDNLFDIKNLVALIGLNRSDERIELFINKIPAEPINTVDRDDDAIDEFIEFKRIGFGLHFMNDFLESIHFQFGRKSPDYSRFANTLPLGICFNQSKPEVLKILGSPNSQGGGFDKFFGQTPDWFKYNRDGYAIHIEFDSNKNGVEVVTIMAQ